MPRPFKVDRPVKRQVYLPTSLMADVELRLFSEAFGRVPYGRWQEYIQELVQKDMREWKESQK